MRRVGWNTLARPALTFWQWRFIPVFRCCRVYEYSCPASHKPMRAFLWRAYRTTRQRRRQKESPGCMPAGAKEALKVRYSKMQPTVWPS